MSSALSRYRLCSMALAAVLMFASKSQAVAAAARVITDADKGGSVQLRMGEILEVHLSSNPTTGYKWYVHPKSTPLLKLLGQSRTQAREPGVGRPILQVFRFQAVAIGDGVLLLHYIRAWERQMTYEEQYDVRVSIR
jgi:inhibitor of cysteine peptidase